MRKRFIDFLAVLLVAVVAVCAVLLMPDAIEVQQRLNGFDQPVSTRVVNAWP